MRNSSKIVSIFAAGLNSQEEPEKNPQLGMYAIFCVRW